MPDRWIVIPNWDELQHYKDRDPAWIKLYTRLASNPDWENLTLAQRGLLVEIWILYARSGRKATPKACAKQVGRSYKASALEALIQAGFIELSDRPPLAPVYTREEKEKKPLPLTGGSAKPNPNGEVTPGAQGPRSVTTATHTCPHCGVIKAGPAALDDHIANVHYDLQPQPTTFSPPPTLEGR